MEVFHMWPYHGVHLYFCYASGALQMSTLRDPHSVELWYKHVTVKMVNLTYNESAVHIKSGHTDFHYKVKSKIFRFCWQLSTICCLATYCSMYMLCALFFINRTRKLLLSIFNNPTAKFFIAHLKCQKCW